MRRVTKYGFAVLTFDEVSDPRKTFLSDELDYGRWLFYGFRVPFCNVYFGIRVGRERRWS